MKSKKSKKVCKHCPLNDDYYDYEGVPKWWAESNRQANEYWEKNQHVLKQLQEMEKKEQENKD